MAFFWIFNNWVGSTFTNFTFIIYKNFTLLTFSKINIELCSNFVWTCCNNLVFTWLILKILINKTKVFKMSNSILKSLLAQTKIHQILCFKFYNRSIISDNYLVKMILKFKPIILLNCLSGNDFKNLVRVNLNFSRVTWKIISIQSRVIVKSQVDQFRDFLLKMNSSSFVSRNIVWK